MTPDAEEPLARQTEPGPESSDPRDWLAAIVESSDDAIVSKNLNGIVTTWNQGATRVFGYSPEEMIGQPVLRLIPPELHHEEDMILSRLRAGERIDHYETIRMKKSGERFEVSVTISPIRDAQGRIVGASKTARDISARKRMEQVLVRSEKFAATGRMAATIAHEINNPLESVMNLVFLARTSGSLDAARGYLHTVEKELERVAHIVRQTLGYYRDASAPVQLNLREMVEDVLAIYQGKLTAHAVAVDCRFDAHRPLIANKGELVQVLSNVIANSIDAMPSGGVLSIQAGAATESGQEGVRIVVRDTGVGIPQQHLSSVFEPFFTTKGNLGTGIGLWVARQLMEKRHGTISIASCTDPGKCGTILSIFLPFAVPPDANAVETKTESGKAADAPMVRRC